MLKRRQARAQEKEPTNMKSVDDWEHQVSYQRGIMFSVVTLILNVWRLFAVGPSPCGYMKTLTSDFR